MTARHYILIACFSLWCSLALCSDDPYVVANDFTLNPGPPGKTTITGKGPRKDVTCTFSFTAQGGTNEDWKISLESSKEAPKEVYCIVTRDGGKTSYLFFQEFSISIKGANIDDSDVQILHKGNRLSPDQYKVNTKDNTVSSTDKFKYEAGFISVKAQVGKARDEF